VKRRPLAVIALATFDVAVAALGCLDLAGAAAAAANKGSPYAARGSCAGYPKVDLRTPAGWCVGLLADANAGLRFPRRVLEVAPGRYWLVDMGSWEPSRGRLLEFALPARPSTPPAPIAFSVLADKLDRPLGLVRGPDGKVWIGEAARISRVVVGAIGVPVKLEPVIDGLPAGGAHPLKELAFGGNGRLYFNVGSATDACRDAAGMQPVPCPEVDGPAPRASVWEATLGPAPAFDLQGTRPFARGLRNSVALAFVPGADVLLQGENSIDYGDEAAPPEELNVLRDGAHYGWPYCTGNQVPARGYEGRFDCKRTEMPARLWPAHAAPLQMLAVPAGAANAFAGQLVVAWHGYRAGGHRIVSHALDAKGRPRGEPSVWVDGWAAQSGVRPRGAPTGVAVDSAGRLLMVEDRHKTLLMLVRESP
jgi:glucose/arabinose dehydrogenase